MNDFWIAVPTSDLQGAMEALKQGGYEITAYFDYREPETMIQVRLSRR